MSPVGWKHLPLELRFMILKEVLGEVGKATSSSPGSGRKTLALYATVSTDWQLFFEKINFRRLVLSSEDLVNFHEMIIRRQSKEPAWTMRIEHIWLRLSLLPYPHHEGNQDCQDCREPESETEIKQNDTIFTNAIRHLLQALALLSADKNGEGLTLEFSASSPSDSEHFFKSWYHLQKDYPHLGDTRAQQDYIRNNGQKPWVSDPAHGFGSLFYRMSWARKLAIEEGPDGQKERRQYSRRLVRPLKFAHNQVKLPEARIITEFVIRRQFFRDISTRSLRKLLQSLPSLRILRRENWRLILDKERKADGRAYAARHSASLANSGPKRDLSRYLLLPMLPRGLRHLQLFEDFDIQLHGKENIEEPRRSRIELLPSLSVSTPYLQHLAVGFLTDAIDCFGLRNFYLDGRGIPDCATYLFPCLENVILTSQEHLRPDEDHDKINALLRAAAAVALKMPKLRVMELWNYDRKHACVFRYDSTDVSSEHVSLVVWRSTWDPHRDLVIQADVIEAWEKVVLTNHSHTCHLFPNPVRFERWPLPFGTWRDQYRGFSYGLVIKCLKLAHIALHPTSAMQALCETDVTQEKMLWY